MLALILGMWYTLTGSSKKTKVHYLGDAYNVHVCLVLLEKILKIDKFLTAKGQRNYLILESN